VDLYGFTSDPCAVNASLIDFGGVPTGSEAFRSFTIQNLGPVSMSGDVMLDACDPAFQIVGGGGPYTLGPGGIRTVTVRFAPTDDFGDQCDVLTGCATEVALSGTGLPGQCQLSATTLDYGVVPSSAVVDRSFTIHNPGPGVLAGTVLLGAGAETRGFSILAGGGSYALGAGATRPVTVRFAPTGPSGSVSEHVDPGADCPDIVIKTAEVVAVDPARTERNHVTFEGPNPFASRFAVRYSVREAARATIEVFDLTGRRLRSLDERGSPSGRVFWDGTDHAGLQVPNGVYLLRASIEGTLWTRRVCLIR
jgi:hypothetical protein